MNWQSFYYIFSVTIFPIITIVFFILQLLGVLKISWWWILIPSIPTACEIFFLWILWKAESHNQLN